MTLVRAPVGGHGSCNVHISDEMLAHGVPQALRAQRQTAVEDNDPTWSRLDQAHRFAFDVATVKIANFEGLDWRSSSR
jgi:hypothetical protein